ncbi:PTS galactitol transporter subunit IIB [Aeromicrobium phragmitis]|uniref:PTS galactitol transporter subunit IIB n=2 Tax=Aeromicrobium TaxID=2040 RepID=A0A3N6WP98_9ACTN|nr:MULTISPECIES: PTS sugar transporter subunit IIB [Aeromicrobium]RLV52110.1 PTS galactitol transporter subunit IIB [Aeromicrobium phragmitis]RQN09269.1 PTS galactitol transporter subunit IIB [Aeromicrobium camelliae]
MKTIIVACGGGIATSQTVAVKLENLLADRGLRGSVSVEAININSIPTYIKSADVYVSIAQHGEAQYDIPTFSGIPFLTGMGAEDEFAKILTALGEG